MVWTDPETSAGGKGSPTMPICDTRYPLAALHSIDLMMRPGPPTPCVCFRCTTKSHGRPYSELEKANAGGGGPRNFELAVELLTACACLTGTASRKASFVVDTWGRRRSQTAERLISVLASVLLAMGG